MTAAVAMAASLTPYVAPAKRPQRRSRAAVPLKDASASDPSQSRRSCTLERVTNPSREPIAVIGTGYVGLVTAAGFAELGNEVWCVDVDAEKIERLRRGESPIYEPGLVESLAASGGRLHFSTELAPALEHARLLFVAVGTPPTYSGDADLSAAGRSPPARARLYPAAAANASPPPRATTKHPNSE
jgi:threonine dehydrogenase-like Zn-dependent dehydrogenase